ncbi:MAG: response regulator, partial [Cyanobacteria bacterium]|nr:response regulator [Cyanobacteriota bacterium]
METESSPSTDNPKTSSKPLVLVVDDDLTHQRMMELLADRLQISAFVVSSCAQAIDALNTFSFDLILMDYRMPEVDGCNCTRGIREMNDAGNRIPIVAVTAHVTEESRMECAAAGMNDFL